MKSLNLQVVVILMTVSLASCTPPEPMKEKGTENALPGDTALPSTAEQLDALNKRDKGEYRYSVEDFFRKPDKVILRMSPDGKYLSYMQRATDGKQHLVIQDVASGKTRQLVQEKDQPIRRYLWLNNERVAYAMDKGGDENYHVYAISVDGSNEVDLTPFDGVKANLENDLKDDKEHIIVTLNKNNPKVFEPYKVNINTGKLEQLMENKDEKNPIMGYQFDRHGELRAYGKQADDVFTDIYYKNRKTGNFELVVRANWYENFNIVEFDYTSKNPDDAYVVTNLDSDKSRVVLYDLAKKKVTREIYANESYDVENMRLSRKRGYELDYISFEGAKPQIVPVSTEYKKIHEVLTEKFGDRVFSILDATDAEDKLMVVASSDRSRGVYYQYDTRTQSVKELISILPHLDEADMSEMTPIQFSSRDGLTIHGYVTRPKSAKAGEKIPLIVVPHGGPQGVRDEWRFSPLDQLFASRGYATLRVNFRISGGYGKTFLKAGFKQVGRKAMDDVEDGIAYVVKQGWVDEKRIGVFGGSHGGYAVLMGLVKTPDLYACGVDYVGVSNIETFMNSIPPYWEPYRKLMKDIWYDLDNPKEKEIALTVSPVHQVDKIKKPLFVVQGANDPRVNINESDQIVSKLRARGFEVPYMVKYNEGHGFAREENNLELFRAMMGFFAGCFAPDA
ncbi:MAG: S9 family peptidase [Gammaproteobacteria bacterium]|nr:S9 family peptidase [Gammaproteobacteria bacterium]